MNINNIESPRERLIESYDYYIEQLLMGNGKVYKVAVYQTDGDLFESTIFQAYNREHLFIEIANTYMLENINVGRIDVEEIKKSNE